MRIFNYCRKVLVANLRHLYYTPYKGGEQIDYRTKNKEEKAGTESKR